MKWIKKIMTAVLMTAMVWGMVRPAAIQAAASGIAVTVPDNKVITYKQGDKKNFKICIANTGENTLNSITIAPKLRNNGDKWPFQTEYQSYSQTIDTLEAGQKGEVSFDFTARGDAAVGRYTLSFDVSALEEGEEISNTSSFYVNVAEKEQKKEEQKPSPSPSQEQSGGGKSGNTDTSSDEGNSLLLASAGGFDNGTVTAGGGEGSASGSVPRVIVTGFDTNPAEVKAGSNFTLTIHLKNTSKATKVSNMLFDLERLQKDLMNRQALRLFFLHLVPVLYIWMELKLAERLIFPFSSMQKLIWYRNHTALIWL